ncbi:hypothetical protein O988_07847 [Pseudogymnoascus sp. VKM F-3808]|nr:hypothetical protein O988_07847 [Pseudogymnoascus sp. VKM F-3808]
MLGGVDCGGLWVRGGGGEASNGPERFPERPRFLLRPRLLGRLRLLECSVSDETHVSEAIRVSQTVIELGRRRYLSAVPLDALLPTWGQNRKGRRYSAPRRPTSNTPKGSVASDGLSRLVA